MPKTQVVNLYREPYDVYIGRAGRGQDGYFGNPFKLQPSEGRGATLQRYRSYFLARIERDSEFKAKILELKGKRLGCFCAPQPCHGDIICEWLESQGS